MNLSDEDRHIIVGMELEKQKISLPNTRCSKRQDFGVR